MSDAAALTIDAIRECLEGAVPGVVATCAADGTPNASYVSQVHYLDARHVALSFQFFNKTRENVLASSLASVLVTHPASGARFVLRLEFLRTETAGPLFESMKAKLAGIASHTGMSGVFRLRGADVYRVLGIDAVPGRPLPLAPARASLLAALRRCAERLSRCADLESLLESALEGLEEGFGIRHAMVLMRDEGGRRLYTLASRGYEQSGVGAEIEVGQGVIGVAAEHGTPIRLTHMAAEYAYGRAIRESARSSGLEALLETAIPMPGLAEPQSQLAVPIVSCGRTAGVLFVESAQEGRFTYDDEDALMTLAAHIGMALQALQSMPEAAAAPQPGPAAPVSGPHVVVRFYAADCSVFIGDDYLIKGVAGAIFRKLLSENASSGRVEFSNRELRLDPTLRLPDISDNLEARLVLLQRRLAERSASIRIEKAGRGRFRLAVERPFRLMEV